MTVALRFEILTAANLVDLAFSKREAALCFVHSQHFVADEVKRRAHLCSIDYLSFVEALARVTIFKPLPTLADLSEWGAESVVHFVDTMRADGKYSEWCTLHAPHWDVEERDGRAIGQTLDMVLQLTLSAFNADGSPQSADADGRRSSQGSPTKARPRSRK